MIYTKLECDVHSIDQRHILVHSLVDRNAETRRGGCVIIRLKGLSVWGQLKGRTSETSEQSK